MSHPSVQVDALVIVCHGYCVIGSFDSLTLSLIAALL